MTKKDFNELAKQLAIVHREVVNQIPDDVGRATAEFVWFHCIEAVILACRATSANFDTARFRDACRK